MVPRIANGEGGKPRTAENIAYICQMLGELRQVAANEGADMLCYLIEMAFIEACDVQAGKRALSLRQGQ